MIILERTKIIGRNDNNERIITGGSYMPAKQNAKSAKGTYLRRDKAYLLGGGHMADRRMFSKRITDSDTFVEMPSAAQALYFHLNQAADDDGFNNQIQLAMMKSHSSAEDLKTLLMKNFIIRFESGVIVITHWKMHNTLRKDRYTKTTYQEEFAELEIKENLSYSLRDPSHGCQVVAKLEPQVRLGKDSIGKDRIGEDRIGESNSTSAAASKHKYGKYNNVLLEDSQYQKLAMQYPERYEQMIDKLSEGLEIKNYKYKNHYLVILKWDKNDSAEKFKTQNTTDHYKEF